MTNPDSIDGPNDLNGWHDYGTYVTLLVRREDAAGTPQVKLMDVDQFSLLVRDLGSVPEVWAIGNDGNPHQGRHRIVDDTIAFHFPAGSENDFGIDVPAGFPASRAQPRPEETA